MKPFYLLLLVLVSSCNSTSTEPSKYSSDQLRIGKIIGRYDKALAQAPNALKKEELGKDYLDTLSKYLVDSMDYRISNVKVQMTNLDVTPIQNVYAFVADFEDADGNTYWMEFDYPEAKKDSIKSNPAYRLISSIPEKTDTVLSFFYMGDIEWKYKGASNFKMQVVPFAKDQFINDSTRFKKKK